MKVSSLGRYAGICLLGCMLIFSGCGMLQSTKILPVKARAFVNALMHKDLTKARTLMVPLNPAKEHEILAFLDSTGVHFNERYGKDVKLHFRTYSTSSSTGSATKRELTMQIENGKATGNVKFFFDDNDKILSFYFEDTPDETVMGDTLGMGSTAPTKSDEGEIAQSTGSTLLSVLWIVLGLAAIAINIIAIVKVKKSYLRRKGWYYVGIVILNAPTFTLLHGQPDFHLYHFELMGFGFMLGELAFAIPVFAFYAMARAKRSMLASLATDVEIDSSFGGYVPKDKPGDNSGDAPRKD